MSKVVLAARFLDQKASWKAMVFVSKRRATTGSFWVGETSTKIAYLPSYSVQ